MSRITEELLNRHLKTHCEKAVEEREAISVLENFMRSGGKINTKQTMSFMTTEIY